MSTDAPRLAETKIFTVSELITELCRWPDNARIRLSCPDTGAELGVVRIDGPSKGLVDIELQSLPQSAPVVPA